MIVVADHSHAPVEQAIELQATPSRELSVLAPSGARPRDAEIAAVPGAAQRDGLRAAARGPRRARAAHRRDRRWRIDGVDLALWRPAPREGAIAGARRRAALRPGRRRARRARRALVDRRRRSRSSTRASRTASCAADAYPDALGARRGRRSTCPTSGRRAALAPRPATSSPTGAASTTSAAAATARCTASTRSARWPSAASTRPHDHGVVVDRRRRADGARALRRLTGPLTRHAAAVARRRRARVVVTLTTNGARRPHRGRLRGRGARVADRPRRPTPTTSSGPEHGPPARGLPADRPPGRADRRPHVDRDPMRAAATRRRSTTSSRSPARAGRSATTSARQGRPRRSRRSTSATRPAR